MELSIVIPVYRSAKNTTNCLPSVIELLRCKYKDFEVLIIIDYPDRKNELQSLFFLAEKYKEIKIHSLQKNFGQHFATLCGYYLAKADSIVCLDEDMILFLPEICKTNSYKNYDAFYFYYNKNEMYTSSVRKYLSILYKYLIIRIVNLKKHSTFRIISKELRDKLLIEKHYYWNLDVMIFDNTKNIGGTTILNCNITDSNSNYNYKKLFKVAFEIAYENNTFLMNLLFAAISSILFFLLFKNSIATILFFCLVVFFSNIFFYIIKKKTPPTIEKISKALM